MSSDVRRGVLSVALLFALSLPSVAAAAPGGLDTSFSGDGTASVTFGADGPARSVVLQPDGKLVVAGVTGERTVSVTRLLVNGALDPSFSNDGKVTADLSAPVRDVAVHVQPDGRIATAAALGYGDEGWVPVVLMRYLADGRPDGEVGACAKSRRVPAASMHRVARARCRCARDSGRLVFGAVDAEVVAGEVGVQQRAPVRRGVARRGGAEEAAAHTRPGDRDDPGSLHVGDQAQHESERALLVVARQSGEGRARGVVPAAQIMRDAAPPSREGERPRAPVGPVRADDEASGSQGTHCFRRGRMGHVELLGERADSPPRGRVGGQSQEHLRLHDAQSLLLGALAKLHAHGVAGALERDNQPGIEVGLRV